tara:strand:- start:532 stop:1887 length:1356 start_codon:yes stop_codon:yes gene_type:complete
VKTKSELFVHIPRLLQSIVLVAMIALCSLTATAQTQDVTTATGTVSWLHVALEQRGRLETLTNRFYENGEGASQVFALRSRLYAEVRELADPLQFVIEVQDSRGTFADNPFFLPEQHSNKLDFLQAQIQLSSNSNAHDMPSMQLQLGRFTMDLGGRRLAARNRMRNTTNAFDGVLWRIGQSTDWTLRTFASRPVVISPTALDSSRDGGLFWGSAYTQRLSQRTTIESYYLGLKDDVKIFPNRQYSTLGGRLIRTPLSGAVDLEIESVWQFGRTDNLTHNAHFQHGTIGYQFSTAWQPRIAFQYDFASGDDNPDDQQFGRFDTLFGARRFELNPTGIYGPFVRSNLHTPGLHLSANPNNDFRMSVFYRAFWLAESRDAWVGPMLQDPTGKAGRFLGNQVEIVAIWQLLPSLNAEIGYAHFYKGSFIDNIFGSFAPVADSDFFYAAWTFRTSL